MDRKREYKYENNTVLTALCKRLSLNKQVQKRFFASSASFRFYFDFYTYKYKLASYKPISKG